MLRSGDAVPELSGLGLAWATVLGIGFASAGVLQALGPPHHGASASPLAAANVSASAASGAAGLVAARRPGTPAIPALLARVQNDISDNPDGPAPDGDAAKALQQVAHALPDASDADRALAAEVASGLYDRAKTALDGGRIDEEQRWLALGSLLAPPPDLAPATQVADQRPAHAGVAGAAAPSEDFTPNESEADAGAAPAATQASAQQLAADDSPSGAPGQPSAEPAEQQRAAAATAPAPAERAPAELPPLRAPAAQPSALADRESGNTQLASAAPPANQPAPEATGAAPEAREAATPDTEAEAPQRSPVATVAGFYAALHRGDGYAAQDYLVPEKRGHGHYAPAAMSRFYGGLVQPLTLVGEQPEGDHQVAAQYRFRSGWGICNGSAVVQLRGDMIQSITAKNHC
ncbi:MAG: hypothetical protein JO047_11495 [Alphaproteobacteria bacterium]|nr:hypothetical protein [Alphaproteobacteria bacterium]